MSNLSVNGVEKISTKTQNQTSIQSDNNNSKVNSVFTSAFNGWTQECADSITNVDSAGKPIYSKNVEDFDMAGQEFVNDIQNNNGANAGQIYKEKALETSREIISNYDTDNDGAISPEEQINFDLEEYENKYGNLPEEMRDNSQTTSLRAHIFMDLDKNGRVDEREYSAFLYTMDANNPKNIANGKISRDEYVKTSEYFEKPLDDEAGTFRGRIRAGYKSFFGYDPAEGK